MNEAKNKIKNIFYCTGHLLHKNYDEDKKSLLLVLALSVPKRVGKNGKPGLSQDYPGFVVNGDYAQQLDEQLAKGDCVTILGHLIGVEHMHYTGKGNYRLINDMVAVGDIVIKESSKEHANIFLLSGEVTHVFRNDDAKVPNYNISIRVKNMRNGTTSKSRADMAENGIISVTYFDSELKLEPKKGDFVYVNATIRTTEIEADPNRNGDSRKKRTSLVAKGVSIDRI